MAAIDLITNARALYNLNNLTPSSAENTTINALITACSRAIEKWCRRDFVQTVYDELYSGNGDRRLFLRHYPLNSVQSVRYRPSTVLKVINNDTATNQQARVQATATGFTLTRVASGVSTSDTSVTYASYVTLGAVAAAITALGNGWSAQVAGDANNYGNWPSADLYVPNSANQLQGALTARGQFAELKMHTEELAGFQWDARHGWLLRAIPYTDPELLHPEDLIWPVGINNFRVQYTAGYATVPEDVQEACAMWVAALFYETKRDPGLKSIIVPGSTNLQPIGDIPPYVLRLLTPYRDYKIYVLEG
jgi:hypothetical protein